MARGEFVKDRMFEVRIKQPCGGSRNTVRNDQKVLENVNGVLNARVDNADGLWRSIGRMPACDTELFEIIRTDLEMHGNRPLQAVMADDQFPVSLIDHRGGFIPFRLFFDKADELAYARVVTHTRILYIPCGQFKRKPTTPDRRSSASSLQPSRNRK
jgi:hypothetical protein